MESKWESVIQTKFTCTDTMKQSLLNCVRVCVCAHKNKGMNDCENSAIEHETKVGKKKEDTDEINTVTDVSLYLESTIEAYRDYFF